MTLAPPAATVDLDEFRLVRVLGQGGMGTVYLGYDTVLERDVAIKLLRERTVDEDTRLRFLTEARAVARLDHPNVIAIFRASTTRDGHPYLVQELIRGHSLDRADLPLEATRALDIALGIARGLAAAHRRGILHRDIKPANVMIDDSGTPKLLDFGVAKLTRSSGPIRVEPPAPAIHRELGQTIDASPSSVAETLELAPAQTPATLPRAGADHQSPSDDPHALTAEGAVIGTPRYMAPEIWRGEPATVRSDLYSLGVLLYEVVTGSWPYPQHDRATLETAVVEGPPPRAVTELAPELDGELATLIMSCLARDPGRRPESADEIAHRIDRILIGAPPVPEGNPYPGLAPFAVEHRAVFYGRGTDISAVVDRLRSDPLVVVAGDSGIGKSSLCRAGVVPAVLAGALGDARTWKARTIIVGRHAVSALRDALGLAEIAEAGTGELARAVGASADQGVVIFLDQFEELVTLNEPAEALEAAGIIANLARGVPGVKILIAVRGDFLTRVAALPELGALMTRSLHLLRVLSLADARDAVVGPAKAKGVEFETAALVETLASSIADQPGSLPLLSFALAELWQRRDVERAIIPAAALEAIGGVAGGLARHADGVIGALGKSERIAARRITLQLVTADGTRAERERRELCSEDDPAAIAALEAMIRGRLVVGRNTSSGEAIYELAHDSLIAAWSTLRGWRDDVAGQRGLRTRLAAAADEWRRLDRRSDTLWNRAQLAEVAELDEVSVSDRAFLAASRAALRRRRLGRIALAASLPAVAIATWLVIQNRTAAARTQAVGEHVDRATLYLRAAEAARDDGARERSEAFRLFDAHEIAGAEAAWKRLRGKVAAAHVAYAAAITELEAAVLLDGSRTDVRSRLARTTYDHALVAEADRDDRAVVGVANRLATFDVDGKLLAAWREPATISIDAPGAVQIELQRYESRDGRLELGPSIARSISRLVGAFEPGSYLIELRGSDGLVVRYPLLLARAEKLSLALPLPPAAKVPAGMVFVPPGRFLYGTATDDVAYRGFLQTSALHPVTTAGYLIAITEVTFADWMMYLRALPAAEREQRRPKEPGSALEGGTHPEDPYVLTLRPTTTEPPYVAREGQPLGYRKRAVRQTVRWERLPVSGISFADSQAYAGWLSSTGRVPGARLCTDVEWERAARGADGRLWSHGNRLDPDDANIDETYGREPLGYGPDEIGSHPRSTSPFGLVDMVGNAWEWVAGPGGIPVQRGGSWYHTTASALSSNRDVGNLSLKSTWLGLRICADAP